MAIKASLEKSLRALGDNKRLMILCAVFDEPKACVSDLAEDLGMSIATASHHLRALASAGLLKPVREGKRICYQPERSEFSKDLKKLICKYK